MTLVSCGVLSLGSGASLSNLNSQKSQRNVNNNYRGKTDKRVTGIGADRVEIPVFKGHKRGSDLLKIIQLCFMAKWK